VEGGAGRQAKFLRLLGVKDADKSKGKGKGKSTGTGTGDSKDNKGRDSTEKGEEKAREAALAQQYAVGLAHRHHRHQGLGL